MVMSDFTINLDFYCQPLEALGLRPQTLRVLKNVDLPNATNQLRTVRDMLFFAGHSPGGFKDALKNIPAIGKNRAEEIYERCKDHGIKMELDGLDRVFMHVFSSCSPAIKTKTHLLTHPVVGEVREMVFEVLEDSINDSPCSQEVFYRYFGIGCPKESLIDIAESKYGLYRGPRYKPIVGSHIDAVIRKLKNDAHYWRVLNFALEDPHSLFKHYAPRRVLS